MTPRLVLDTNAFRGLTVRELEGFRGRGFVLSVSEIALNEAWVRSATNFANGTWSREKARGFFFRRVRKLRAYVDSEYPVAVAGGHAFERIKLAIAGTSDPSSASQQRAEELRRQWEYLQRVEFNDEEWLDGARARQRSLDWLDEVVRVAETPEAVWWGVPEGHGLEWATLSDQQKTGRRRRFAQSALGAALAERVDAFVCACLWRLNEGEHRRRVSRDENDGPDLAVTIHIGEGFFLLTRDVQLLRMVDLCGTYQAPWVRRPEDLDEPLPAGPPWGESARVARSTFVRRIR